MKMKFVTFNREVHKWVGVVLALFVIVIGVTGVVLIHKKDFRSLKETEVPGAFIPGWYSEEMGKKGKEVKALAVGTDDSTRGVLMAGTKAGLMARQEGRWMQMGEAIGGAEVTSLLLTERRWLAGTQHGLYQSLDSGRTWEAVKEGPLGEQKKLEVKTLQTSLRDPETIWMGTMMGIYRSQDGGEHWEDLSAVLPMEEKARHVATIAFDPRHPGVVLFGTHNGLYRYDQASGVSESMEIEQMSAIAVAAKPRMTLDKYLTDLHTGKLFGDKLWALYDFTSIGLILFVGTGLYIWIYPTLAKRRKAREQARLAAKKSAAQLIGAGSVSGKLEGRKSIKM